MAWPTREIERQVERVQRSVAIAVFLNGTPVMRRGKKRWSCHLLYNLKPAGCGTAYRRTRLFVRSNGWAAVIIRRRKGYKWEVGFVGQRMVGCCGNTASGGSAAVRLVCSLGVKPTLYPRPCRSGPFLASKAVDIFLHFPRKY